MPYTGGMIASGGVPPYTFALTGGSLPPGLVLDPNTGIISGTITEALLGGRTYPRLCYTKSGWLYFDYPITDGGLGGKWTYEITVTDSIGQTATAICDIIVAGEETHQTLCENTMDPGWRFDQYTPSVLLHYQDEEPNSYLILCGCSDGTVQNFSDDAGDSGGPINCKVTTVAHHFGDARALKQFGDFFVDCDGASTGSGISVSLLADYWSSTLVAAILTGAQTVNRFPTDLASGVGEQNVNAALAFTWTGIGTLYGYELTALMKPERIVLRATDWIDLGQSRWLQGLRITANTFGVSLPVRVEYDGGTGVGGNFTLTVNHNGELQLPYSFTPVIAHRIRLLNTDTTHTWEIFNIEPIGPLAPELVSFWVPQPTSHGLVGYQFVREIRPVLQGNGSCTISATCEFGSFILTVPLTGAVQKLYLRCPVNKGMIYSWQVTGGPVRIFLDDFEIVCKQWGGGAFQVVKPFGQPQTGGAVI